MAGSPFTHQSKRIVASIRANSIRVQCPFQTSRTFSSNPVKQLRHKEVKRSISQDDGLTAQRRPRRDRRSSVGGDDDGFRALKLSATQDQANLDPNDPRHGHSAPLLERIRIVPDSPSYFSARPNFTDDLLRVQELYLKWKILPRTPYPPDISWHNFEEAKAMTGNEQVLMKRFRELIKMLKDLSAIEPVLMPQEVKDLLESHKRSHQPGMIKPKSFELDEWGRSLGVGKRKTSTAKAYLVMGEGEVLINGKSLTEKFRRLHDRESAMWPLKVADRMDKYNVFALVNGGGSTGQAEALTLAVANALLVHEPTLEGRLLQAGLLYRDPRVVERKKPGHLKARKKPAWVKR